MTSQDEQNSGAASAGSESTQSGTTKDQSTQNQQEAGQELIDELTRLGQKFVAVVEVAWNSEQRKKIEEDLRTGLVSVAGSLEEGFKRVSTSKEAKEAVNAAEEVADKVRTSKIAVELSDALAQGLRSLSEQLDKLTEEMKQKSATPGKSASSGSTARESQDIPIARDDES